MHLRIPVFFAVLGLGAVLAAAPARSDESAIAPAIQALVASDTGGDSGTAPALGRFYAMRNYAPAWVDAPAHVTALLAALAEAPRHGLSFPVAKSLQTGSGIAAASRDVALTRLALDYATALASGSVRPETFETDWAIPAPTFDAAAGLKTALDHDLVAWYAGLAPHHPAYERLMTALARYRAIAESGGWATIPRGDPLKLGMVDPRVRRLRSRLMAEGDLMPAPAPAAPVPMASNDAGTASSPVQKVADVTPADPVSTAAADPETVYDGTVEMAVKRFQVRNGIAVDGTVGPRTLAALNVTARQRVRQIELNLERWRSLPHDLGSSYMMVNVPAERLDIVDHDVLVISMKVVVGGVDHPTPVLRTTMTAVTLNPTWTIPASIVTNELLPKSKREPKYLAKNDIVFTPGRGWQQMPGPKNPLGRIKFESPNRFDVYLHDTPSRIAFDRYFRAQSHGCVRLEHADELAGLVLQDTAWNAPALTDAVADGATRRIDLKRRWRIYILYATSFVDDDGTVEFRDDLYGRDARLREALTGAHPEPQRQAKLGRL